MSDATTIAYLALGSNLGDRAALLNSAIETLRNSSDIEVLSVSRFVETDPVGVQSQNKFLNAAVKVRTKLSPRELLLQTLNIEQAHGRDRKSQQRWGPRSLDIDLILYGDEIVNDVGPPRLQIPHSHMADRLFVLEPLAEIAPDAVHPILGLTVQSLLEHLQGQSETEYPPCRACSTA